MAAQNFAVIDCVIIPLGIVFAHDFAIQRSLGHFHFIDDLALVCRRAALDARHADALGGLQLQAELGDFVPAMASSFFMGFRLEGTQTANSPSSSSLTWEYRERRTGTAKTGLPHMMPAVLQPMVMILGCSLPVTKKQPLRCRFVVKDAKSSDCVTIAMDFSSIFEFLLMDLLYAPRGKIARKAGAIPKGKGAPFKMRRKGAA